MRTVRRRCGSYDRNDREPPDESRTAGLALARSRRPRAGDRPVRAHDDGRLSAPPGMAAKRTTFELFVRKMPPNRAYLVFAGLEQAIGDLLELAFSPEQIDAIRRWPVFRQIDPAVMDALAALRFEGDVWAVPEGTVVFPGETLLRVTAPLPQAQWVETLLLASLAYPTLVASKAARMVDGGRRAGRSTNSAPGGVTGRTRASSRRARRTSRASRGRATSRRPAGWASPRRARWPTPGSRRSPTSRRRSRPSRASSPRTSTLLVDTYDTLEGVRTPRRSSRRSRPSGSTAATSRPRARRARAILDERGRSGVKIMVSGDLDEYRIARLVESGRTGRRLRRRHRADHLSRRAGAGDGLQARRAGRAGQVQAQPGQEDVSDGQASLPPPRRDGPVRRRPRHPGRRAGRGGAAARPVVRAGRLVGPLPSLEAIRARCRDQLAALPPRCCALDARPDYPITYSDALEADARRIDGARPIAPRTELYTRASLPIRSRPLGVSERRASGRRRRWPRSSAWPTRRGGSARRRRRSTSPPGWPRRARRRS